MRLSLPQFPPWTLQPADLTSWLDAARDRPLATLGGSRTTSYTPAILPGCGGGRSPGHRGSSPPTARALSQGGPGQWGSPHIAQGQSVGVGKVVVRGAGFGGLDPAFLSI